MNLQAASVIDLQHMYHRAAGTSNSYFAPATPLATLSPIDRSDECTEYLCARTETLRNTAVEGSIRLHQTLIVKREMQQAQMMGNLAPPASFRGPTPAYMPQFSLGTPTYAPPPCFAGPPPVVMPPCYSYGYFPNVPPHMQTNNYCPYPPVVAPAPAPSNVNQNTSYEARSPQVSGQRKTRVDFKSLWGRRYDQLVEFKHANGHCNVPQRFAPNVELGRWVKDQRTFKTKGKISQERIDLLEEIGFQWRIKCHDEFWEKMFKDLTAFKDANGNCNVSKSNTDNVQLAHWVDRTRRARKRGKIPEDRIKQLDAIGFSWNSR